MQTNKKTRTLLLSLQALALSCTVSLLPPAADAEDAAAAPANESKTAETATSGAAPATTTESKTPAATAQPAAVTEAPATATTAPAPAATTTNETAPPAKASDPSADRKAKRKAQEEALKETIRKKKASERGGYYKNFGDGRPTTIESGIDSYAESIKNAPKIAAPPPSAPIPLAPVIIDGAHMKVAPSANPMGAAGKGWKDDASISGSITLTRHVNTAKEMLAKGNWTLAKKHYGSAMTIEPANMEYMIGYYKACLLGQDWPSVVNTLERIFKQDPTKEKVYYADYGKALYFNNQIPQATVALRKAMTMGGNLENVHETMLSMYTFQRDYGNMALEYKALIKINPTRHERMKAVADLLWQTGSQTDAAVYYKMYAKARPSDVEAQQQLGYILLFLKDYPGSIAAYKRALAIAPADPRAKQGLDYAVAQQKAATATDD